MTATDPTHSLDLIFKLLDLPKARGRPPQSARIVTFWGVEGFIDCARYFNARKVKGESRSVVRKVYLSEEGGAKFLYLVEEKKPTTKDGA